MQVRLQWPAFNSVSRFAAVKDELVLERLAAVAEPAFAAVAEAGPEQLDWPVVTGRADCNGIAPTAPPGGMPADVLPEFSRLIVERAGVVACALEARVADYAGPQPDESLQAPNIATAEAEGLALVEGTAAELGLTIATTYPPERRRCEHPDGFPGVVSEVVVTTAASLTPDEELFELVDRYWSSRALTVYRPDNGIAAEGAAGGLISTVYLTASKFGGGPSIRAQLPCALE